MSSASSTVLLANHHTDPLPDVGAKLVQQGHRVITSATLVDTATALDNEHPDLVVFQPLTANIDGFEIQHLLRRPRTGGRPPVLLILGDSSALTQLAGRADCGVDDFLLRPLTGEELAVRIEFNLARADRLDNLEQANRSLEKETITDFKTGLFNDRFFFQRLAEEVERTRRHLLTLSVIVFDFDNFKEINDRFDHMFGDYVLGAFARKLRSVIRQIDIPARLGGDEFALLLPNTDLEESTLLATRLRELVTSSRFEKNGHSTALGLSMGIDSFHGSKDLEPEQFLRQADQALLEAKKRGKNRICLYSEVAFQAPSEHPPLTPKAQQPDARTAAAGR